MLRGKPLPSAPADTSGLRVPDELAGYDIKIVGNERFVPTIPKSVQKYITKD